MGRVLADELGGELDVVLVRKLGAPFNPEFAVGAIDESGWAYISAFAASTGADEAYLEDEKRAQMETLRRRRAQYTPLRPPIDAKGRIVIVVDDGLATGATMIAALHAARARQPARLVCAVPVAAADSLARVRGLADEVVCLAAPEQFYAVGQFYQEFRQVQDEEVVALLVASLAFTPQRAHPREPVRPPPIATAFDHPDHVLGDRADAAEREDVPLQALQAMRPEVPAVDQCRHTHRDDDARAPSRQRLLPRRPGTTLRDREPGAE
jgi:predicted phosphoribosyltransferase